MTSIDFCADPAHGELDICTKVPPNAIRRSSQPKTEEQKAARRARDRLIYAKTHPIQKRSRKDSIKPFQSNSGNIILTDTTSVEARDVPLHEELDVHTTVPLNGLCSSQPKTEEQKAARRARHRMKYAEKNPTQKRSRKDNMKSLQLNNETEAMRQRNRYATMTEEQQTILRKRQNTHEALQQKKSHYKKKKDALCPESIAMENPTWVLEMESSVNQAHRAANSEAAWNYPNFFNPIWRPLSIPPKFEESLDSVNNDDNDMTQMSRHHNVTHGERQALRAQQNQRFQDICVLIGHLLHYMKIKMSWLLNYPQNIVWMTIKTSKIFALIGHLLHYTKIVSWLLNYL